MTTKPGATTSAIPTPRPKAAHREMPTTQSTPVQARQPMVGGTRVLILATLALLAALFAPATASAQGMDGPDTFQPLDVFDLEWVSDPQVSPDGRTVVFQRNANDIMSDGSYSTLWTVNWDGSGLRALTTGSRNDFSPRWSPDGDRLLYVSTVDGGAEIWLRWMDTGQEAKLTNLTRSPGGLSWSPDGSVIAFTMFVPEPSGPFASMPPAPQGADWGPPIKVIDDMNYRADGAGYLEDGNTHVFVIPAEGGAPRQLTHGPWNHGGTPQWTPDGRHLIISANRHEDAQFQGNNSELYEVTVADASIRPLTDRTGPDGSPAVSPDGSMIAYTGFDDRYQGYQVTRLYVMDRDGSNSRMISGDFDRDVGGIRWNEDNDGLYFQYSDQGKIKLAHMSLDGEVEDIATDVGGLSLGRPYGAGQFSATPGGHMAFTHGTPDHPADLAVVEAGGDARRLTHLNRDLLGHKELGQVEEIWYESSHDGRRIQGWLIKPPGFDPSEQYPLILEIHGGPFAMYASQFAAELQLMAAEGYLVLYTNPRGSTGYGQEFGNLIHHAYPGNDYHDLMSGVDAVIERGYVDTDRLYVTGGSGGGVLSSWIVGKTDRFAAAVVQKPVINWYSFVLTADGPGFFEKYWFPGMPWDNLEHYMERSPISLVGNVTTPTMLITGEQDYRTPMSESEQYYQALQLQRVPSVLVRVPDAGHGIAAKPSNLVAKVVHILEWFDRYPDEDRDRMRTDGGP